MSEMRLRDYGYQTKKNDVLRERALTSAFREKGAGWVNKQLRDMLRVAREQESNILFKDMCNFIGSSTEKEIKKIMDEYEIILYNMEVHTKKYDFVDRVFLDHAVTAIGWRNVCKGLDIKYHQNDEKVAEKIKKDMDYVIEVHSHRKKIMEQIAREKGIEYEEHGDEKDDDQEDEEKKGEESGEEIEEYKELDDEEKNDEYEEQGDHDESISLRDYGYSVHKTQRGRIGALKRAVAEEGLDLVCDRLEQLGKYHPVMLEDLKSLKPSGAVEPCCHCVSSQEIRTIVREELSKVFGDIKKMTEDMREMYSEMIA
jgi:hypothetical protein